VHKYFGFFLIFSMGFGQSAWDSGEASFNYGFPIPNQNANLSGSLIFGDIPDQGAGGFEYSDGNTNILTLLAYDLYFSGADTLADVLVIFMSDTTSFEAGNYVVNASADALKIFVWLREIDPSILVGLIDTSFTLEDLSVLNPFISVSGSMEIAEINQSHIQLNFSGTMINTSFQGMSISDGSFDLQNSLPVTVYPYGSLDFVDGLGEGMIQGVLNPIFNSEGAGALSSQVGEAVTYNLLAYHELENSIYDIYGVVLLGTTLDFPMNGVESEFLVSESGNEFPVAVPYVLGQVSLDELITLLASGELPSADDFPQLRLPVGDGSVLFGQIIDDQAILSFENVPMSSGVGDTVLLSEDWLLTYSWFDGVKSIPNQQTPNTNVLGAPFPNPFNSSVLVPVRLEHSELVTLTIFNLLGQEVHAIDFGQVQAGGQNLNVNLGNTLLDGGLYSFSIESTTHKIGTGSFVYLK